MQPNAETQFSYRNFTVRECPGFQNNGTEKSTGTEDCQALVIFSCQHCYHGERCFFCESVPEVWCLAGKRSARIKIYCDPDR